MRRSAGADAGVEAPALLIETDERSAHASACASLFDGSVDLAAPENWIRLCTRCAGDTAKTSDDPLEAEAQSNRARGQSAEAQQDHADVPERPAVIPE